MNARIEYLSDCWVAVRNTSLYTIEEKKDAVEKYLNQEKRCVFVFYGIQTYIHDTLNVEKKKPIGLPLDWPNMKKPDNEAFLNYEWSGWGIITGKESGITVLDFDDAREYNKLVKSIPELLNCRTILTNKGVHIYFKYDSELETGTNVLTVLKNVDLRNDNAIAFCPPTQYKNIDGTIISYVDTGGDIIEMPEYLKKDIIDTHQKKIDNKKIFIYTTPNKDDGNIVINEK